jgi:2,4-dienoyl-CoA reductase-like NADH-dependent reductase (Old Yellow Enzyme family)
VPAEFVVGVRISPEDFGNARGLDLDESLQLARWLSDDGADFLHLSLWDAARNTTKRPNEHPVPLFRAALPAELPIVVAGKVWTREDADVLLEKGADAIAVGRAAIANPDWVEQVRDRREPRRPPLTRDELVERGLSPGFVEYMTRWKGFVAS